MPQLDISTFVSQLFWLGLSFLFLYLMLSRKVLPRIVKIFGQRKEALEDKINQASVYRDEAEALLAKYEQALAVAREEAHEKSTTVLQAFSTEMAHRKQAHLDSMTTRLRGEEEKLYQARQDINSKLQGMAEEIAQAVLEKLTDKPYPLKGLRK